MALTGLIGVAVAIGAVTLSGAIAISDLATCTTPHGLIVFCISIVVLTTSTSILAGVDGGIRRTGGGLAIVGAVVGGLAATLIVVLGDSTLGPRILFFLWLPAPFVVSAVLLLRAPLPSRRRSRWRAAFVSTAFAIVGAVVSALASTAAC